MYENQWVLNMYWTANIITSNNSMINPQYKKPQNNSRKLSEPQFYGPQFLRFQIFQTKFWIFKIPYYHNLFIYLFILNLTNSLNTYQLAQTVAVLFLWCRAVSTRAVHFLLTFIHG